VEIQLKYNRNTVGIQVRSERWKKVAKKEFEKFL